MTADGRWLQRSITCLLTIGIIVAVAAWTRWKLSLGSGVCFTEPTWAFHFGHRVGAGAAPYQDFVYTSGPLALYVETVLQQLLGAKYMSSIHAGALVMAARAVLVLILVRKLVGSAAAWFLVACCLFSPVFGLPYHSGSTYTDVLLLVAGGCVLAAQPAASSTSHAWGLRRDAALFAAGAVAGLIGIAQPGSALVVVSVLVLSGFGLVVRSRELSFSWRDLRILVAGMATGIGLSLAVMAASGDLALALEQTVLGAMDSRDVHGLALIPDAVFGGTLTDLGLPASFVLTFLLLPAVVIGLCLYLVSRPPTQQISIQSLAILMVPLGALVSLATRYQVIEYFEDLPRTFLTVVCTLTFASPERVRRWFGIEPRAVVALGALPLAADWAIGIEARGRNGGDAPALVLGVILLACLSSRLSARAKTWMCAVLAVASIAHFIADRRASGTPYGGWRDVDGPRGNNRTASAHPMLDGSLMTKARASTLDWLMGTVPAGASCFVYGDAPVIYTLTKCQNPTRLDSIASNLGSREDAREAVRALQERPPDFIIAPAHALPLEAAPTAMSSPAAILQAGLHPMLGRYRAVVRPADDPDAASAAQLSCDGFTALKIYRKQ